MQCINISRNIIRLYARRASKKIPNPGIQSRLDILDEKDDPTLQNLGNIDVDELESDFMNIGEMHKEHEKELKYYREKEKFWIVKQKYFKETKINFLTWNDKEQIRYLHQSNPDEWTIEKLAEGFPALPETIKKIIKSKWHMKNESKKTKHDQSVEKNWKLLKTGKFTNVLPTDLINHLLKFSARKPTSLEEIPKKIIINTPEVPKEFSSIIRSYKNNKNESNTEDRSEQLRIGSTIKQNLLLSKKSVTLSMLKKDLPQSETNSESNLNVNKEIVPKFNVKSEVDFVSNKKELNVVNYPEKIKIPKDKYKKGYTYKINDCYYDDDGEFLYRVPGMY